MTTNVQSAEQKSWAETPPNSPPLRHAIGEIVENQTWLDKLANPIQQWLLRFFGQPGQPNRKVKDILNGTWLGHPVHPVLTDIPIGAWSGTMLLDLVSLNDDSKGLANGADLSLARRTGQRRAGIAWSTAGYLASLFSAYLGGELVFAKGVGVNHDAWEGGSDDFVVVMNAQDLVEGKLTRVDASGIPAVLLKKGKSIYAIGAICTHLGGPLDEGEVHDGVVQCPWHGSCFRMQDGSVVNGPAVYAEPAFDVRVRDGKIELRRLEHA